MREALTRRKANQVAGRTVNSYFCRTYNQKEIDYIEEYGGRLYGYEFKWRGGEIRWATRNEFLKAYPGSELTTINQANNGHRNLRSRLPHPAIQYHLG